MLQNSALQPAPADFQKAVVPIDGRDSYIDHSYVEHCRQVGAELCGALLTRGRCLAETATDDGPAAAPDRAIADPGRLIQKSSWFSWSGGKSGLFGVDMNQEGGIGMQAIASGDILAFEMVLESPARREYYFQDRIFRPESPGLNVVFLPRGTKWGLILPRGRFRSLTVLLDGRSFLDKLKSLGTRLPAILEETMAGGMPAQIETPIPLDIKRHLVEIFQARETLHHAPLYFEARTAQLTSLVLEHLSRRNADAPRLCSRSRARVALVRDYIDRTGRVDINIDRLANMAAMNRTKLRAIFKEQYGVTISDYRTTAAMKRADAMLRSTTRSIYEISLALGYADSSGFIVAYRKYFGHSPGRIRRR
jgi:AraC-like DNA-binding protein